MLHGYLILIVGHSVGQVNPLKPEAFAATIFFNLSFQYSDDSSDEAETVIFFIFYSNNLFAFNINFFFFFFFCFVIEIKQKHEKL